MSDQGGLAVPRKFKASDPWTGEKLLSQVASMVTGAVDGVIDARTTAEHIIALIQAVSE